MQDIFDISSEGRTGPNVGRTEPPPLGVGEVTQNHPFVTDAFESVKGCPEARRTESVFVEALLVSLLSASFSTELRMHTLF